MACEYCKNKFKNKRLIEKTEENDGVIVWITHEADGIYLNASGWYDQIVGMDTEKVKVNYCPNCGKKVVTK